MRIFCGYCAAVTRRDRVDGHRESESNHQAPGTDSPGGRDGTNRSVGGAARAAADERRGRHSLSHR